MLMGILACSECGCVNLLGDMSESLRLQGLRPSSRAWDWHSDWHWETRCGLPVQHNPSALYLFQPSRESRLPPGPLSAFIKLSAKHWPGFAGAPFYEISARPRVADSRDRLLEIYPDCFKKNALPRDLIYTKNMNSLMPLPTPSLPNIYHLTTCFLPVWAKTTGWQSGRPPCSIAP